LIPKTNPHAGPGLFDTIPPAPATLPPATIAALMEVVPEGRRMWVWSILATALDGRRTVAAVREVLNHDRMDRALVARLTDPMIPRIGATP
jgi:hypothetical protein